MYRFSFSSDNSSTTGFEFNSFRTSLLTVLRVVYAIIRLKLSSGKTMVSILHVNMNNNSKRNHVITAT